MGKSPINGSFSMAMFKNQRTGRKQQKTLEDLWQVAVLQKAFYGTMAQWWISYCRNEDFVASNFT